MAAVPDRSERLSEPLCPACGSIHAVGARTVAPRIDENDNLHVCLDCGCLFAFVTDEPKSRRPVCPVCDCGNAVKAGVIAPRMDALFVCVNCGCVYAFLTEEQRDALIAQWRKHYGPKA
jgi:transcription elongation factor Elf1